MTCVAIAKNRQGKIMMAADRRLSGSDGIVEIAQRSKIVKRGEVLLGMAGDWALGVAILYTDWLPTLPILNNDKTTDTYAFISIRKALINLFRNMGYSDMHGTVLFPGEVATSILLALRGQAYIINIDSNKDNSLGDIQIEPVGFPAAIGDANLSAIISLNKDLDLHGFITKDHMYSAIETACKYFASCALPKDKKPDILISE